MNILLATRNKDKFKTISMILEETIFKGATFHSLNDIKDEIIDKEETGDVINRAYQKALNSYNSIKENIYDYIIGIDDVIEIRNEVKEDVKNYIQDILDDKYLKENEIIHFTRAYTFMNKEKNYKNVVIKIPYKYKKLKESFTFKEYTYPLNNVLTPIDSNTVINELSKQEGNNYYLKYSKDKLEETIDTFKN